MQTPYIDMPKHPILKALGVEERSEGLDVLFEALRGHHGVLHKGYRLTFTFSRREQTYTLFTQSPQRALLSAINRHVSAEGGVELTKVRGEGFDARVDERLGFLFGGRGELK